MTGFICHDDYYDRLKRLSDEEVGHLFRMLMLYHAGREEEMEALGFIENEGIAFDFISDDIDRMEEKTKETSETNRLNGAKGGRPRKQTEPEETEENRQKPNETERNPNKANKSLYKDKDKDKDIYKKENPLKGVKEKDERFDRFWSVYPRKESKQKAKSEFMKLNPDDELLAKMIAAVDAWKGSRQWQEDSGQYIPHPDTWIRNKRWEDELPRAAPAKPTKTVVAQQYEQRDYSSVQDELMEQQDREMEEYLRKEREKGANNNAESGSTADVLPDDSEWLFNGTG